MKKIHKILAVFLVFILSLNTAKAFSDVPQDAWFNPYVRELAAEGIIDNVDKFRPDDELNRAEFVKMVIKGAQEENKEPLPRHPTFDDVRFTDWFAPFVERAASLGIISGYTDPEGNFTGKFGPADSVTRAQAVKILVGAFDLQAKKMVVSQFNDVTINDWFYAYVSVAGNLGIVQGYEGNLFKPNQPVKRSEMAKMLTLAMEAQDALANPLDPDPEDPQDTGTPPDENPGTQLPPVDQPQGTLFKANTNNLNSDILVPDKNEKYVGRYSFKGILEGFTINTLTIVNDQIGSDFGDQNEASLGIKMITLKYPDKDGHLKTASSPLKNDGTARFSNLDFFVKRDVGTPLEIYVTLNDFSEVGEALSGETFRLGIQDVNNTTTTFKAVGESSNETITLGDEGLNQSESNTERYIIRKSVPTFALVKKTDSLTSGTNDLIGLKVTADKAGSLALSRLTFEVSVGDADNANLALNSFKIVNGASTINDATIYDATGMQDLSLGGGGELSDGLSKVIVSFDQEQVISAGETRTFYLKAEVSGTANNDDVITKLATGDEDTSLSGLTAINHENTGKIYVSGDATAGIFTTAATDFSQLLGNSLNILWSDLSAQVHQYPEVNDGAVTSDSGSADWSNGYRFGVNNLGSSVLSK